MKNISSLLLLLTFGFTSINAQCVSLNYTSSVEDFGCNSCGSIAFEATSYFDCPGFSDAIIRIEVPQGFNVDDTDSDFIFVETIGQFDYYESNFEWIADLYFPSIFSGCYDPNDAGSQEILYSIIVDDEEYDTRILPLSVDFYQTIGQNQTSTTLLSDLIFDEVLPPSGFPFFGKYNILGDLIVDVDYVMSSSVSKGLINLNPGSRVIINDGINFNINNYNIFGCEGWQGIQFGNNVTVNIASSNIDDANILFEFGNDCSLFQSNSIYNDNTVTILMQDISNPSIFTQFPSRISNTERGIAAENVNGEVSIMGAALNISNANVAIQANNSDIVHLTTLFTSVINGNIGVLLQYDGSFTGYNINLNGSTESTSPFVASTGVKSYLSNNSYLILDNVEFTNWGNSIYNLNPGLFEVDITDCQFQLNGSGITSIGNIGGYIDDNTSFDSSRNILGYGNGASTLGLHITDGVTFNATGNPSPLVGSNIKITNIENINISDSDFELSTSHNILLENCHNSNI